MFAWFLLKCFLEDTSPSCGATDTPVLDFWWCLPWVSKPEWIPHLHALLPACNEFLRFTSGVTPTDCIEVSMATKPFWSMYLQTCLQALVEVWGSNPWPSVPQAWRCRPLGHSGCLIWVQSIYWNSLQNWPHYSIWTYNALNMTINITILPIHLPIVCLLDPSYHIFPFWNSAIALNPRECNIFYIFTCFSLKSTNQY